MRRHSSAGQTEFDSEASKGRLERGGREVLDALVRYLEESQAGRGPVVRLRPMAELARELRIREWMESGGLASSIRTWLETYLASTTRLHHPCSLAHQVGVPEPFAALADLIHGLTNNPMAIYEMGPAAATIEYCVIDWMLGLVGWPGQRWPDDASSDQRHGAGVLTHGGSLGNLTALLAARAAASPQAWDEGMRQDLVVLAPKASHYSISRAASIIGLGRCAVRNIPVDTREVLMPDALPGLCRQVRDEGLRVMAVVANACATSTGLYDPLEETGRFCRESGLWFHVDGAHGASALVSPRERRHLRGVELADSLIWDAHKMLRTSSLATAVLFRDEGALGRAFQEEASYLFYGENADGIDLIHRTVECTKAALGLKVFFSLAAVGQDGLARYIESQCGRTRRFSELIRRRPGFECPFDPQSNVLCFRYGASNRQQIAIRDALLRDGRYHISSTEVNGERYLRLSVMSPATEDENIEGLLDEIERIAASLDPTRTVL